jgi:ribosomal-protein-alanine N-acetyltransferase
LQLAAPDSSVSPGNPEIQFWVLSRGADGALQAAAAGTKWSSGAHVINAVAVAPAARRQGLGSVITLLAAQQHFADGAKAVALGVRGSNIGALAMYRKVGFDVEMHFSSVRLSRREAA